MLDLFRTLIAEKGGHDRHSCYHTKLIASTLLTLALRTYSRHQYCLTAFELVCYVRSQTHVHIGVQESATNLRCSVQCSVCW